MVANSALQKIKIMQRMHNLPNAVKIRIFISDVQYYVPIQLCKTAGSIHLFKIIGMLKPENIKINCNYILYTLEIDWKEVSVTFNDNQNNLPRVVNVKLKRQDQNQMIDEERTPTLLHNA